MREIRLNLENCFGIKKLSETINYSNNNAAIIYAPNGTMKSSLAKTFEAIRDNTRIEEKIYGLRSSCSITDENNVEISKEQVIVINPFNENAYENQGLLMANETLRKKYLGIYNSIESKKMSLYSKIKEKFGYSTRQNFDVRNTMLNDWGLMPKEEYACLNIIKESLHDSTMTCLLEEDDLDYALLFNEKVNSMMKTGRTGELLEEYEKKYKELVDNSLYMQQGVIDHNNYENISNVLGSNGFFVANHEVILNAKDGSASIVIRQQKELNDLIRKEKEQVLNSKEIKDLFEKINKTISKNKDTLAFNAFLQSHPDIIVEYKDIDLFKKKVWIKAFACYEYLLNEVMDEYNKAQVDLKKLRDEAKEQVTDWKKALDLFKDRFFVPFSIEPSNQEDVILNMELPSFKYIFSDGRGEKEVSKENLLNILSTGERRAYYILNMIFQILVAKKRGKESIVILDDISESFDYKNKYAIVEYIRDISEYKDDNNNKIFKILLLTHNFDFYRTISSRITKPVNSYIAFRDSDKIKFETGQYTKNIFMHYKKTLSEKYSDNIMLASIPFVRNLIEYTEGDDNEDYLTLTSILHYKKNTKTITLMQIQDIFNKYWYKNKNKAISFAAGREEELIYDIIMKESNNIADIEKLEIENKLILSMAIRLKGELYMQDKIMSVVPNGQSIVEDIFCKKNQSAWLIKAYKENINDERMNILEIVAMITPENIHLNSFMFEPILDMSLKYLYKIYNEIKLLS
jgi:putative macrophage infection protein, mimD (mimD)